MTKNEMNVVDDVRQPLQGIAKGEAKDGDFVHATQDMATEKGFKNVSGLWVEKCCDWDALMNQLETSAGYNRDVNVPLQALDVLLDPDDGQLKMRVGDEGLFVFSEHSCKQITAPQQTQMGSHVIGLGRNRDELEGIAAFVDARWKAFKNGVLEKKADKQYFLRLRDNGNGPTVRAVLSEKYGVIDHRWIADQVREKIGPNALISHFDNDAFSRTGGDYVRFNVLIPDSMRVEDDSDYGGMFSITNSEVGSGRLSAFPSLFRAICMNGCIWGAVYDKQFKIDKVHKGEVDYDYLSFRIGKNLTDAIPLLDSGLDHMFVLRERETLTGGLVGDLEVLGMLANDKNKSGLALDRNGRRLLYQAYGSQMTAESGMQNGAFAAVNAITRYAQENSLGLQERVLLETKAGEYMESWQDESNWQKVVKRSQGFDAMKDVALVGGVV